MSAVVKLGSKLPGDFEVNGLDALAEELIDNPDTLRAAFVLFDASKIETNTDTGKKVPTARVRRFEPLGDSDDISEELRAIYFAAVEKRTGVKALPLDIAEVVHTTSTPSDED